MRCRPGDLAVIVRSFAGNEGRIVRVVRYIGHYRYRYGHESHEAWFVEPPLVGAGGDLGNHIDDSQLRPIRPDEGTDETLTWLTVPSKETEHV